MDINAVGTADQGVHAIGVQADLCTMVQGGICITDPGGICITDPGALVTPDQVVLAIQVQEEADKVVTRDAHKFMQKLKN
jgi:shikimate kinase